MSFEIGNQTEFPGVGQIFAAHREITEVRIEVRSAKTSYGVTSLRLSEVPSLRLARNSKCHGNRA